MVRCLRKLTGKLSPSCPLLLPTFPNVTNDFKDPNLTAYKFNEKKSADVISNCVL